MATFDEIEEQVERLCDLMAELVERGGDPRPSVTAQWRKACRALLAEGRSPEEVERVMRWATTDDYWSAHVLSMPDLRRRFPTLRRKASSPRYSGPIRLSVEAMTRDAVVARARERGVHIPDEDDQLKTMGLAEEALER